VLQHVDARVVRDRGGVEKVLYPIGREHDHHRDQRGGGADAGKFETASASDDRAGRARRTSPTRKKTKPGTRHAARNSTPRAACRGSRIRGRSRRGRVGGGGLLLGQTARGEILDIDLARASRHHDEGLAALAQLNVAAVGALPVGARWPLVL
jgi:hypothetical protein